MKGGGALFDVERQYWYTTKNEDTYSFLESEILNRLDIKPNSDNVRYGKVGNLVSYLQSGDSNDGFNISFENAIAAKTSNELEEILNLCRQALELRTVDQRRMINSGFEFCQGHKFFFLALLKATEKILEKKKMKSDLKNRLRVAFINPWKDEMDRFIDSDLCNALNSLELKGGLRFKSKKKTKSKKKKKSIIR